MTAAFLSLCLHGAPALHLCLLQGRSHSGLGGPPSPGRPHLHLTTPARTCFQLGSHPEVAGVWIPTSIFGGNTVEPVTVTLPPHSMGEARGTGPAAPPLIPCGADCSPEARTTTPPLAPVASSAHEPPGASPVPTHSRPEASVLRDRNHRCDKCAVTAQPGRELASVGACCIPPHRWRHLPR